MTKTIRKIDRKFRIMSIIPVLLAIILAVPVAAGNRIQIDLPPVEYSIKQPIPTLPEVSESIIPWKGKPPVALPLQSASLLDTNDYSYRNAITIHSSTLSVIDEGPWEVNSKIYNYRLPFTITGATGANVTDYETKVEIDTAAIVAISLFHASANGTEVEFVKKVGADETTGTCHFWLDSDNGAFDTIATRYWVEASLMTSIVYNFYYYFDPAFTADSSNYGAALVWKFWEDFNTPVVNAAAFYGNYTDWEDKQGTPTLVVADSVLTLGNDNDGNWEILGVKSASFNASDLTTQYDYRFMAYITQTIESSTMIGMNDSTPGGGGRDGAQLQLATPIFRWIVFSNEVSVTNNTAYTAGAATLEILKKEDDVAFLQNDVAKWVTTGNVGDTTDQMPMLGSNAAASDIKIDWIAVGQYVVNEPTVEVGTPTLGKLIDYQVDVKLYFDSTASEPFEADVRYDYHFGANGWDSNGYHYAVVYPDKLYKSIDEGETYNLAYTFPDSPTDTRCLFIDSNDQIFVSNLGHTSGTAGRLYRSTNGGGNFTEVMAVPIWPMDEDPSGNLYAGQYDWDPAAGAAAKIWKSTGGGGSGNWTDIGHAAWVDAGQDHIHGLRINPTDSYLYTTIGDAMAQRGCWRSKLKDGSDWVFKARVNNDLDAFIGCAVKDDYIYLGTDYKIAGKEGRIWRFQDDDTGNVQAATEVLDTGGTTNNADKYRLSNFYLEVDTSGRIWAAFSNDGWGYVNRNSSLWSSANGTSWTRHLLHGEMNDANWQSSHAFRDGTRNFGSSNDLLLPAGYTDNTGAVRCYWKQNELDLEALCRTDFGDVRFTNASGDELDYYINLAEGGSSNFRIFTVEVDSIAAASTDTTIYVYYGNAGATTTSSGNNTFILFDDFEYDLSKWTETEPANTEVRLTAAEKVEQNQSVELYSNHATNYPILTSAISADSFKYEAYLRVTEDNKSAVHRTEHATGDVSAQVDIYVDSTIRYYDGSYKELQDYAVDTWYRIAMKARHTSDKPDFDLEIDDTTNTVGLLMRSLTTSLTGVHEHVAPNYFGSMFVDLARVRQYVYPEPIVGEMGSRESVVSGAQVIIITIW